MIGKTAFIFVLFFCAAAHAAQPLPVLPYPQQVTLSDTPIALDATSAPPLTRVILGQDPAADALIRAAAPDHAKIGPEGYILILNNRHRIIAANTQTGLFYGQQTLNQLTRARYDRALTITDWPDYPLRVIYDDISRGPIPTIDYIKRQIDRMSELKINALSFYIEHVVQPLSHPDFAPPDGKLTIAQIKELSAYAAARHMQLIGSFQSFGHFEKILALPQYKHMGETNTLISPLDPDAKKFLADVIGELCDAFNSPCFNVNCDETFDLAKGRSKDYIDKVGPAKFYADHLRFLYDITKKHGKRMMMWGDVALQHPEIIDLLPDDIIYLTWEYAALDDFAPWIKPFAERRRQFMVCPGILNSYRLFPDHVMAKTNIANFTRQGLANGATGVFTTIWDDGGTYLFDADWYGVHYAAEKSWNTNTDSAAPTFDHRYETTAYDNTGEPHYTKTLHKLLELRAIDLTYNLNDQLWHQKILPDPGKQLIVNNATVPQARQSLTAAKNYLKNATATRNQNDLAALNFAIDQYTIIIDTRTIIADTAAAYAKTAAQPAAAKNLLSPHIAALGTLLSRYAELQQRFRAAWLSENQPHWLDNALAPYEKKQNDLRQLRDNLTAALSQTETTPRALPAPAALRLNITLNDRFYFKNWMLAGPFPLSDDNPLPAFLYSENPEYNKPPAPGDFTRHLGKTYRWQKYSSTDGGIVDLDDNYKTTSNTPAAAYAYCLINSPEKITVNARLSSAGETETWLNGEKIHAAPAGTGFPREHAFNLSLAKGPNHILIKLRAPGTPPWTFTFRLQDDHPVTNHKHKYRLNDKTKEFDAE